MPAQYGASHAYTLNVAGPSTKLLSTNSSRNGAVIENTGPGTIYWDTVASVSTASGHALVPGAFLIFENCEHTGELYAVTDQDNTIVKVSESA